MGFGPCTFPTNLFLEHYESTYIRPLREPDTKHTNKFENVFWLRDDLTGVIGRGVIDKSCRELFSAFWW